MSNSKTTNMKHKFIYIILFALLSNVALTSCEDMFGDFLDKMPGNELTEEEVFSDWESTKMFFFDTYNFLRNGRGRINNSWLDSSTDLAMMSYSWGGTRTSFNIGNYYASSGAPELVDTWEHYYRGIRKCNKLLENIDDVTVPDNELYPPADATEKEKASFIPANDLIKAEARVLRAYFYWELAIRYGAVPVITESQDPSDETLNDMPRPQSVADVFSFILFELEDAKTNLHDDSYYFANADTELGRVTKGMDFALQSRIKLYLASPQYQSLGLATWQDAVDQANYFISDYNKNGQFGLYSNSSLDNVYQDAILTRAIGGNPEVIFWRNDGTSDWLINEAPVGYGGNGGLCPSQNLVDMYDMADGSAPFTAYDATGAPVYDANGNPSVNETSGYSDANPYANRDPRFYQTVLYQGAQWWNRAIDVSEGGTDNPVGNANATKTGYYNKKYMNDSETHPINGGSVYRNWIFIRYAEILLNYAEALNEVNGPTAEVFNTLQQIRNRVGMTALLSERSDLQTKEAMRNFIHKERTIELAFEDHRAWDVRRWGVAEEALSRPIYGLKVDKEGDQVTYSRKVAQERVFQSRMYLYPIPEQEIWKTGWENNPGW